MLSKKQARAFFLGGTLVTFLIFIGLTVYSLSKAQDQTNREDLSESAIRGKWLFDKNNCMGCHTIMGEGGYYAPELTKVVERMGAGYIKAVLMTKKKTADGKPNSWNPNGRKMVAYEMTEQEADDMVAFFEWIGNIDLNGFETVVSPLAKEKK